MNRRLAGKSIVVTRDRSGNAGFAAKIVQQGGIGVEFATIKFKSLTHTDKFLKTLAGIAEYDWVIFTSANGVAIFFDYLRSSGKDGEIIASAKVAAIGSRTAFRLDEFAIKADFVPTIFTSKELGRELTGFANLEGKKVLLLRSKLASNQLVGILQQAGAEAEDVAVYTAEAEKSQFQWLTEKIAAGRLDWLTFTSPFMAGSFFEQIPKDMVISGNVKVASIGPVTFEQLKNLGLRVDVQADVHTMDGLLKAIADDIKNNQ